MARSNLNIIFKYWPQNLLFYTDSRKYMTIFCPTINIIFILGVSGLAVFFQKAERQILIFMSEKTGTNYIT